jgi:Tfp pilus assembly PilM family ATPase
VSGAAGLDIGGAGAAFVRASRRGTEVAIEAAALVAFEGGEDDLARARAIRAALGSRGAGGAAAIAVGGREAIVRYVHLPVAPPWRVRLLMDVEVRDVEEKAGEPLSSDYRLLTIPEALAGPDAGAEIPVLVALAKEGPLERRLAGLRGAGLGVLRVLPSPVALFDAYVGLGYTAEEKTVLLVHAGRDSVELAIVRDGFLVFARSLPAPPGDAGAPLDVGRAQQLAGGIASALQLARAQQKLRALAPDEVLLSGAHALEPTLSAAIRQALRVEPAVFDPLERATLDRLPPAAREAIEGRGPELAIALGLALSAAHPRALDLDLLPRREKARREFATRTVFLYAGGAALAVALAVAAAATMAGRSAVLARRAELRRMQAALEERRDALEARRAANRRTIETIDALARRTEPGAALLRLLERLRIATPPRVAVAEVILDDQALKSSAGRERAPREGPPEVAFRIRGEVDNATGEADALLRRFEEGLRDDPAVVAAKVTGTPIARPDATREFVLSVRMRGIAPEEP